ncbi:MAG: DUF948 domain-containing protein [Motilibacteraceae bacterium]
MSAGEVAGLIAALAFVVLVGLLALPLLRLTRTIAQAQRSLEELTEKTLPTLQEATAAMRSVNASLAQTEGIASDVHDMSSNVSGLTGLVTSGLGGPAIKVSAFSYGVQRAIAQRRTAKVESTAGARIRAERRARRAAERAAARSAAEAARAHAAAQNGAGS